MPSTILLRSLLLDLLLAIVSSALASEPDTLGITRRQHRLGEASVRGSLVRRVNASAFNAVAINTRQLAGTNLDLAHALEKVSGLKVREDGGVGSGININLNGFTGKHVKVFIDGVPIDASASSFSLGNIPAALASRIEVYKGVVPAELGGDALGGAINIVTDGQQHSFVDASYSYGSFNTHRSNLSAALALPRDGYVRLTAYQNYSDNDYRVRTQLTDLTTGIISQEESWFRRFHDCYHNEAAILQMGVRQQPWADALSLEMAYSHEYTDIQNANLMKIVFGGKFRTAEVWSPSFRYEKRDLFAEGLSLRFSARCDFVHTQNVDTLSRTYNWAGDYREKDSQGEGVPTQADFRGRTLSAVGLLSWRIADGHSLAFNHTLTAYRRRTTDASAGSVQSSAATFMRRVSVKNVSALSYKYVAGRGANFCAFSKFYRSRVRGPVNVSVTGNAVYEEQERATGAFGWGAAATAWPFGRDFQLKLSYERTLRLPTDMELFGDGDYEEGNATLRPERSDNLNLNFSYNRLFGTDHDLSLQTGLNCRLVRDYIIRTIGQKGTAVSTNHGRVRSLGIDIDAQYTFRSALSLGGSYAIQDSRNRERMNSIGAPSVTFGNRVPNLPYSFGSAFAGYTFAGLLGPDSRLTLGADLRYTHRFFRSWSGEGAKLYVPEQLCLNARTTLALAGGRYNITLEGTNLTDACLYDNYSLQKPGRSFMVKFRVAFVR